MNIKTIFFMLLLCVCIAAAITDIQHKENPTTNTDVIRVIDGDTIKEGNESIRFLCIDTPEITNGKHEYYGEEAKQYVINKTNNKEISRICYGKDKYSRFLCWIFLSPETSDIKDSLNYKLVENGYAKVYMCTGMYKEDLIEAENYAKENKLGIWNN